MKHAHPPPADAGDSWRDDIDWLTHKTPFITFLQILHRTVLWPFMTVEFEGTENLPEQGPCIIASNHVSNLDPAAILVYMPRRYAFYMAKKELFATPMQRWYMPKTGAFPVNRGGGDLWALAQAGKILEAGEILGMFPEGTRNRRHARLRKGKVGTVKLALEYQAPILPAAVLNTQNVWLNRWRTPVTIRLGPLLDVSAMRGSRPITHPVLREITDHMMTRIAALLPPEQRGFYAG